MIGENRHFGGGRTDDHEPGSTLHTSRSRSLLALFAAAAFVLVVGCTNGGGAGATTQPAGAPAAFVPAAAPSASGGKAGY
jgi:hypothetical protein